MVGGYTVMKKTPFGKNLNLSTPERFLKEINTLIFGYLWAGKPEKISRQNLFKKYQNGGPKMIDIYKFEKSEKMSWLKRIASQNDCAWYKLLTESVKNICNVTSLGGEWCSSILKKVNPFWTNVLRNWMLICESNTVTCNQDILHSALWFNKHISVNKIYFPDWSAKSISTVADIVDSTGKVMDLHLLKKNTAGSVFCRTITDAYFNNI